MEAICTVLFTDYLICNDAARTVAHVDVVQWSAGERRETLLHRWLTVRPYGYRDDPQEILRDTVALEAYERPAIHQRRAIEELDEFAIHAATIAREWVLANEPSAARDLYGPDAAEQEQPASERPDLVTLYAGVLVQEGAVA